MFGKKKNSLYIKKPHKKQSFAFFYTLVILVVTIATLAMFAFIFFKVEYLSCESTSRYSNEEIIAFTGIEKGDNLVLLDSYRIEQNIFAQFPYIDSATVTKILPSTIEISLVEAEAYYSVAFGEGYVLVSSGGKLLELVDEPKEGTAHINAGEIRDVDGMMEFVDPKTQEYLTDIMDALSTREEGEITEIDLSNIYDIKITYDDRLVFLLGGASDLEYKIKFGFQIIDGGYVGENEEGTLDLSFGRDVNRAFLNATEITPDTPTPTSPPVDEIPDNPDDSSQPDQESSQPEDPPIDSNRGDDIPDV